jgi:hypothetical protein
MVIANLDCCPWLLNLDHHQLLLVLIMLTIVLLLNMLTMIFVEVVTMLNVESYIH